MLRFGRSGVVFTLAFVSACGSGGVMPPPPPAETGVDAGPPDARPEAASSDLYPCSVQSCDDGIDCTEDSCHEGRCAHRLRDGFCLIAGSCYADGTRRADDSCQRCDAKGLPTGWTDAADLCADDGLACTQAVCTAGYCTHNLQSGYCLASGACVKNGEMDHAGGCGRCDTSVAVNALQSLPDGTPCAADAYPCTDDECQAGACAHSIKSGSCLIEGVCYGKAEANPGKDCRVCDPSLSATAWSDASDGSACPPDNLSCTNDVCDGGSCTHPLKPTACLIKGTCFALGDIQPNVDCRACNPAVSQSSWSVAADGTSCSADSHPCTEDRCSAGACVHPTKTGACMVGGACYSDGARIGAASSCTICDAASSSVLATYAEGSPCDDGAAATVLDLCLGGSCRGFSGQTWEWISSDSDTVMTGVAPVEGTGYSWGVGQYVNGGTAGGFVVRLNGTAAPSSASWLPQPVQSIHHRLLVGQQGMVRFHNGTIWSTPSSIGSFVGTTALNGVWGATVGTEIHYYLAGAGSTLVRCLSADQGGSFSCTSQSGAAGNVLRVFGTTNGAALGPRWAIRGSSFNDIYYSAASSVSWASSSPQGCLDALGAPCGSTTGRLLDLWAASPADVWAVGEEGIVLRYDGASWTRVVVPGLTSPAQSAYQFRAVFALEDVVILAGDRNYQDQYHDMVVLTYNKKLQRWFEPQYTYFTAWSDPQKGAYRFRDIGGASSTSIYFVGSFWEKSAGEQRALYLASP